MKIRTTSLAIPLCLLLGPAAPPALAAGKPRVVALPRPPAGPEIRQVRHDLAPEAHPGQTLHITVLAAPGARVTADLDGVAARIPCTADAGDPATYGCKTLLPPGSAGIHRLTARAVGSGGRASTLSSPLPVVVTDVPIWEKLNAVNTRMKTPYFAAGSADLDEEAKEALRADAKIISANPGFPIHVEGHCDSEEKGDLKDLSDRRAQAALDFLTGLGVPKDRMTAVPLAATQPVTTSSSPEKRALNRHVLVLLQPPAGGAPEPQSASPAAPPGGSS